MNTPAKSIAVTLTATILSGTAAFATTSISDFDRTGNGFATQSDIAAVLPGFTTSDFHAIDSNSDNRISAVELQSPGVRAIVGLYLSGSASVVGIDQISSSNDPFASFADLAAQYPGLTQSDFSSIDTNDDNRVSFGELYDPRAQSVLSRHDATGRVLGIAQIDTDRDGFADRAELAAAYPGVRPSDFRVIDANRDNRVSFSELYSLDSQIILGRTGS